MPDRAAPNAAFSNARWRVAIRQRARGAFRCLDFTDYAASFLPTYWLTNQPVNNTRPVLAADGDAVSVLSPRTNWAAIGAPDVDYQFRRLGRDDSIHGIFAIHSVYVYNKLPQHITRRRKCLGVREEEIEVPSAISLISRVVSYVSNLLSSERAGGQRSI